MPQGVEVQVLSRPPHANHGLLAQLARASRLHREGRGFESLTTHHEKDRKCSVFFVSRDAPECYTDNVIKGEKDDLDYRSRFGCTCYSCHWYL